MKYKNIETLAGQLRIARRMAGLTQKELAEKMKTKQPAIARAENGNVANIRFMEKFVRACGYELRLHHISITNGQTSHTAFVAAH